MVSRRSALLAAAVLVLAVVGVFSVVEFHALESETSVQSGISTYRVNDATAPTDRSLSLLVVGDGPQADRIEAALVEELSTVWPSIVPVEDDVEAVEGPVLAVNVSEDGVAYNPVTPSATVDVHFGFVGGGNATVAKQFASGEGPPVSGNRTPYVVGGSMTVVDRSRGIASVPGYRSHLRRAIVDAVATKLTRQPGMPNAPFG